MRHGSKLSYEELRDEAHRAVDQSKLTQEEIANRLDVARGSIASAVTTAGERYQKLQRRILAELTDYEARPERTVRFRALRQDHA